MDYRFSAKLPEGFPLDPGADEFLVILENGRAVHCCGISCSPDGSPADLEAYTLPEFRQKGYFKSALRLLRSREKNASFSLLVPEKQAAETLPALRAMGARLLTEEYLLSLDLESPVPDSKSPGQLFFRTAGKKNRRMAFRYYLREELSKVPRGSLPAPAARCIVSGYGEKAFFSSFSVRKDLRGKHLGREALFLCLGTLKKQGFRTLSLHVSGENRPALSLYKKTGFHISETLYHYIL